MKCLDFGRFALSMGVAAAMLAGCGGSQPLIGAPGAMPQSRAIAAHGADSTKSPPLLYVAEYSQDAVLVFNARAKDPAAKRRITDSLNSTPGDCIDSTGTLYVTNQPPSGPGWVSEYLPGRSHPSRIITKGMHSPTFCAIDAGGNLWITNISGPNVTEFKKGATKPYFVISKGLSAPDGIAIDHSGNIYVGNGLIGSSQNIQVYAPGTKSPSRTIADGITDPVGITVDAHGTLYVTNCQQNNVQEYRKGASEPYQTITNGMNCPDGVVVNANGYLYVSDAGNSVIVEFPPGSINPSSRKISKGIYAPEGLAYFPPLLP